MYSLNSVSSSIWYLEGIIYSSQINDSVNASVTTDWDSYISDFRFENWLYMFISITSYWYGYKHSSCIRCQSKVIFKILCKWRCSWLKFVQFILTMPLIHIWNLLLLIMCLDVEDYWKMFLFPAYPDYVTDSHIISITGFQMSWEQKYIISYLYMLYITSE